MPPSAVATRHCDCIRRDTAADLPPHHLSPRVPASLAAGSAESDMSNRSSFFSSTVGSKTLIGLTGLLLFGFLVTHLAGNLSIFAGSAVFNAYTRSLAAIATRHPALIAADSSRYPGACSASCARPISRCSSSSSRNRSITSRSSASSSPREAACAA